MGTGEQRDVGTPSTGPSIPTGFVQECLSSAFVKENIDTHGTMIKELDLQARRMEF